LRNQIVYLNKMERYKKVIISALYIFLAAFSYTLFKDFFESKLFDILYLCLLGFIYYKVADYFVDDESEY